MLSSLNFFAMYILSALKLQRYEKVSETPSFNEREQYEMLAFSLPLLITTSFYLDMDWGNIISAYIGTVISIMFLTSVGCFVSSITALPIVAYLLGLFFGLLIIGFNWGSIIISGMDNIPFYLNGVLDFSSNYQEFLTGQINIASIFYFVSATILFLFFNWLVICDRRIG